MDLQTLFYTVGIIFMTLGITVFVGAILLVWYIRKKVFDVQRFVVSSIAQKLSSKGLAIGLGSFVADMAMKRFKGFMHTR